MILIKNGRIWNGEGFFRGDVLTEGGQIAQIGQALTCEKAYTFDAAGKIVSPGLVDAHTHIRGISTDKYGICTEAVSFPFGVTCAVDAGAEQGSRVLLDSFGVKNVVFACTKIRENRADLSFSEKLLNLYGDKAVGLKVYFAGQHVLDTTPLKQVCDFAHGKGLSVMVHCNGSPVPMAQILEVLDRGDILTHAFHGGDHNAMADGFESLKAAQQRGVVIDTGFAGHIHTDFRVFRQALKAGIVPDVISTDITCSSAFKRGGRYGMTMCMSMARTAGMAEEDIFRAVTTGPAQALGQPWGQLREGITADIAVLDYTDEGYCLTDKAGNLLKDKQGYRCLLTVANGQVVYRY